MTDRTASVLKKGMLVAFVTLLGTLPLTADAQDRLKAMPGYEQYQKMSKEIPGSVKMGSLFVTWKDGGKAFEYQKEGKVYRFDIAAGKAEVTGVAAKDEPPAGRGFGGRGGRGGRGGERRGRRTAPGTPRRGCQPRSAARPVRPVTAPHRSLWVPLGCSTSCGGSVARTAVR